ncbi:PGF-CTERM sorting domain-containing protein [Haloferax mediterranei ATCC 33500]|uniref:PGF-CTERM sorting domain-containing protein n=1 Tax=Haloferax mediterranei (strain ATCC 33500 / DSM 1411 / JCM 8866 / NBRC 14739 / NCIMB 2177 / R-4) TaxID=523841 RepID=I3R3K9_HALMT|nr:BGTF surface domain-containing protein [Haloferax mediterranei]AFK18819.1 hypothetical protein HFX_1103 [Haloferax mediterranei ATCC 33500]AHZ21814.1 hypothetical protein BM92_03700 [Haloferax mediterranei ATCC 33500]EMA03323.1 hypothetical protein C439_04975 [Haloferax mediterranei ATCC 33500]MDX5988912.1 PGF-CTERM sorting domain-containing protein [Haloferax mediterranei ATCC 33500]QCQ75310.1 PGF-CTERM sorting domain-containing protein [Haloferax mediterranei ATCC 33500]
MRPLQSLTVVFVFLLLLSTPGAVVADGSTVINYQGDSLVLDADTDQHISGTTPFEAGAVIGIRIKSVGGTHPFLVSKPVRVGENGTFDVSFDLSELAPLRGGAVQITVRHNETAIYELNGTVVTGNMPEDSTFTPIPGADETTTTTERTTTIRSTTDSMSGFEIPGFGVGTAIISLLSVVLLARTRK